MARVLLTWAAAITATAAAFALPVQSGHDLFQQALVKERAEGNLQGAIDLYDRIVRDFPEDHALAARALVQMGQCYEKLGKAEARKAYERVIRDYADQAEPLQVARARLDALNGPPRHEMTVRRIWADSRTDIMGEVSPDGRHLSFVDWETGDLAVRDLATAQSRRLTDEGSWEDPSEFALCSRWSPDGKRIAYDWGSRMTREAADVLTTEPTFGQPAAPRPARALRCAGIPEPAHHPPGGRAAGETAH